MSKNLTNMANPDNKAVRILPLVLYKCCMVICITAIISLFLFACNSARETGAAADSAANAKPTVDTTTSMPVDTAIRRDSMPIQ